MLCLITAYWLVCFKLLEWCNLHLSLFQKYPFVIIRTFQCLCKMHELLMLSLRGSDPDVWLRFKLYVDDLGRPEDTQRTTEFKLF